MKVKCIKVVNFNTGKDMGKTDGRITVGKEYVVLSIVIKEYGWFVEIEPDSPTDEPILKKIDQFVVTSHRIPSNWVVYNDPILGLQLSPKRWLANTYGDEDEGEATRQIFEEEKKIIYTEEGAA
jgi:hypothetical protein